jgi:citrate lyase subunit beta / citryl-CoA lyase
MPESKPPTSWLFAPGHDEKLLGKVFDVGADSVLLDLDDAVPPHIFTYLKIARAMVASVAAARAC